MPSNPDICECGSQLFTAVWAVTHADADVSDDKLDPKQGNTLKRPVGFKCEECGALQLTREIPERHASDDSLDHPECADRDMVRETGWSNDANSGRATATQDQNERDGDESVSNKLRNLISRQ